MGTRATAANARKGIERKGIPQGEICGRKSVFYMINVLSGITEKFAGEDDWQTLGRLLEEIRDNPEPFVTLLKNIQGKK